MKTIVRLLLFVAIFSTAVFSWVLARIWESIVNFNEYVVAYAPSDVKFLFALIGIVLSIKLYQNLTG